MIRSLRRLVLLTLLPAAAIAAERQPAAAPRFDDVRIETRGNIATIHVRTSSPTTYRAQLLLAPVRLVVDLEDTVFAWRPGRLDLATPPLRQIRGSQFTKDVSRIVLEFTESTPYVVMNEHDGIRIDVGARTQAEGSAPPASVATGPVRSVGSPSGARPISLGIRDIDIVTLLRALAAESGKNIVIGDEVKGRISITAKNIPLEQALDIVVESRGLAKIEEGQLVRIITQDPLARERQPEANLEQPRVRSAHAKTDYAPAMTLILVALTACVVAVWWGVHRGADSFGPLVMADGEPTPPTAARRALVSTALRAIKGSESLKGRPVLKITLKPGIRATPARSGHARTLLRVKVANVGRRPTAITHVSLILPRRCSHTYVLCTDPRTATYPVELAERRTHSFVFNEDLLADEFGLTPSRFVARVDDVAGRSYWSHGRVARAWKLGRFA
jgi:hypothetical protein